MAYKIQKKLTPYNFTDKNDASRIKYIVIHYFGSLGTALAVANYFANAYRGASAHYSLDEGETIYQSVEDEDIAWHCGTHGTYYHPYCRNSNSLGIEVRPHKVNTKQLYATDEDWYFKPEIIDRLVEFTKAKMKEHNVPLDRVVRHYDVTHKICPNPFVVNAKAQAAWEAFKKRLVEETTVEQPLAPASNGSIKVGDVVSFKGGNVYTSANSTSAATTKPASKCKVTSVYNGKHPYHCVSEDGKGVYGWVDAASIQTAAAQPTSFKVQVTASELNIRKGPGTSNAVVGGIKDKGIYTIVETKGDWGKLKSGAGWIHLGYTKKL